MTNRSEAFVRIFVGIISGIILSIWKVVIQVFVVLNWIITVISGKRNRDLARLCEIWNTQVYTFLRYMTFVSNERPFPFNGLQKSISKYSK